MDVNFDCPQCAQNISIEEKAAGATIECPTCGLPMIVPGQPIQERRSLRPDWWQILNKPLTILLIAFLLWPFVSAWQHRLAMRSAVRELNSIAIEMSRGNENGVKMVASAAASQLFDGFKSVAESSKTEQAAQLGRFTNNVGLVSLTEIKTVPSQFSNREKIIGAIRNGSASAVSDIRLNFMLFAANGSLIDTMDKNLFDVKILQPGQTIGFSVDRELGAMKDDKAALDARRAAKVTAQVVSFTIPPTPDGK